MKDYPVAKFPTKVTVPTTVEVPIKWLEKLIELNKKLESTSCHKDNPDVSDLYIYIDSAKELFKIGGEDE